MFESLPAVIDGLRGSGDAAALVDAAVDWGKTGAACEAQRLSIIAEFAALWLDQAGEDTSLWAVDEEDNVVAQIGIAFGVSARWALGDLEIGAAMRERFPRLAALFLRGEISAKVMATVVDRTVLVCDEKALALIDAACVAAATTCGWSGLSYYKLKNAIDVWVEHYDPGAVRRVRDTLRGRSFTVGDSNDKTGTTAVYGRLSTPGAALLGGRLRTMAKGVCKDDPRTLDQRMADSLEALAADSNRLMCLCGSPTCPAAADDGVGSRFVVHLYAEAAAVDAQPDPFIHGDGPAPDDEPAAAAQAGRAGQAAPDGEAAQTEAAHQAEGAEGEDAAEPPGAPSAPRQCPAPADAGGAPDSEAAEAAEEDKVTGAGGDAADCDAAEATDGVKATGPAGEDAAVDAAPAADSDGAAGGSETAPAETASSATAPRPPRPVGIIPGVGIVPTPLLAALIAAGAAVRPIKAPTVDRDRGYRISTTNREFVQARDLMCRFPGCDRPIYHADLDHTIAWGEDGGPTHASNLKGYCRHHHLLKTFHDGWSEVQKPDGTIILTTPTGHTYTSIPTSGLLFPTVNTTSAPIPPGTPAPRAPKPRAPDRTAKMPKRQRTKAKDRAYRIAAERALNDAHVAERNRPPDF
jgi:hypothetical protein